MDVERKGENLPPSTMEESPSCSVLIVDDDRLFRWSLTEALAGREHVILEADSRESAIRVMANTSPDVILLDLWLPDSRDLSLLALIRSRSPHSRVILMTAHGTPEIAAQALDLGAYRVIAKPCEMHELAALVEQAHRFRPGVHS